MIKTLTLALMGLTMAAGAAYAQDTAMKPAGGTMSSSSGAMMSKPSMSKDKMSDADMKTMKMCQGMTHDAMMKDAKCMDMMKMHPDMMKSK